MINIIKGRYTLRCTNCDTIVSMTKEIYDEIKRTTGKNPMFRMDTLSICCGQPNYMFISRNQLKTLIEEGN